MSQLDTLTLTGTEALPPTPTHQEQMTFTKEKNFKNIIIVDIINLKILDLII